jgi:molecular chaperone GrpE
VTEKSDASTDRPDAPASGERIVIRDKRKISSGTGGKPTASKESPAPGAASTAAPEAAASGGTAAPVEEAVPAVEEAEAIVPSEAEPQTPAESTSDTASASTSESAEIGELRTVLDERTADLQRITAEYANYRKRVERDRALAAEQAVGMVLASLLPVLDDIDRARDHGDLTGPFASVAEQLTTVVTKLGLTAFGAKGDPFDPNQHEAVAHLTSSEVTEPTCIDVMRRGYLLGERLLRPAMVAVADPESE